MEVAIILGANERMWSRETAEKRRGSLAMTLRYGRTVINRRHTRGAVLMLPSATLLLTQLVVTQRHLPADWLKLVVDLPCPKVSPNRLKVLGSHVLSFKSIIPSPSINYL